MFHLSVWFYLGGGLFGLLACLLFVLSFGWRARLFKTQWDYRFTGLVFVVLAVLAFGAGWYQSRQ